MKRVALKEAHAPYTLAVEEATLRKEPLIVERNGEAVAVLVPINEYEAFRVWRETRAQEPRGDRVSDTAFLSKLATIRQTLHASGYQPRTKEEIEAQIEAV